jgi:hypothetical protein
LNVFVSLRTSATKPADHQISMLLYCMGEHSEDIPSPASPILPTSQQQLWTRLQKFDSHFAVKRNLIFERAQFNRRQQEPREPADVFIAALHKLADACEFGALRDQLVCDRIVVGIRDVKLLERLQLDPDLTLEKAVTVVRQSELVHSQQGILRSTTPPPDNNVNTIHKVKRSLTSITSTKSAQSQSHFSSQQNRNKQLTKHRTTSNASATPTQPTCAWCGREKHSRQVCPAKQAVCKNCKKVGHYQIMCRSKKAIHSVRAEIQAEALFLDTIKNQSVQSNSWSIEISVNDQPVTFRIDTGSDATVLPAATYDAMFANAPLLPVDTQFFGPNRSMLDAVGRFNARLQWRDHRSTQAVYVIRDVHSHFWVVTPSTLSAPPLAWPSSTQPTPTPVSIRESNTPTGSQVWAACRVSTKYALNRMRCHSPFTRHDACL